MRNYLIRRCLECNVTLFPEDTTYFCRACEKRRRARIRQQCEESDRRVRTFLAGRHSLYI